MLFFGKYFCFFLDFNFLYCLCGGKVNIVIVFFVFYISCKLYIWYVVFWVDNVWCFKIYILSLNIFDFVEVLELLDICLRIFEIVNFSVLGLVL